MTTTPKLLITSFDVNAAPNTSTSCLATCVQMCIWCGLPPPPDNELVSSATQQLDAIQSVGSRVTLKI